MKKQQLIVAGSGVLILVLFFFFGKTVPPSKNTPGTSAATHTQADSGSVKPIGIEQILGATKSRLTADQLSHVNRLEHSVVRGDVHNQQITMNEQLAAYWRDSVQDAFLPYAWYTGEAAKLENSEKKLTFAAQLFLGNLRGQDNAALRSWMATQSRGLFEQAAKLDPASDSIKIGMGATYIFGSTGENPADIMQGIQQILAVARRDSLNMYAQFMLGLGGITSGQFDKAIPRLLKVVSFDPQNLEAVLNLAEAYERTGNVPSAREWYEKAKKLSSNQDLVSAINERLAALK